MINFSYQVQHVHLKVHSIFVKIIFNLNFFKARRLMTLHRPRRNTTSNAKIREVFYELNKKQEINKNSSNELLHNYPKNFDEDGYLSPLEIKAKVINY
jgi:hypothetical protein